MIIAESYIETNEQYKTGIAIDEYEGVYSIASVRMGNDDKLYHRWGHPSNKDKKPSEKAIPWKMTLGDAEAALKIIMGLRNFLLGGKVDGEEIPF